MRNLQRSLLELRPAHLATRSRRRLNAAAPEYALLDVDNHVEAVVELSSAFAGGSGRESTDRKRTPLFDV